MKKSGAYYRNVKDRKENIFRRANEIRGELKRNAMLRRILMPSTMVINNNQQLPIRNSFICNQLPLNENHNSFLTSKNVSSATINADFSGTQNIFKNDEFSITADGDVENDNEEDVNTKNLTFRTNLRKWALSQNISHTALKDLMHIINQRFTEKGASSSILPDDPRTLLQTPQTLNIMPLNDGEYWHYGLKNCLEKVFRSLNVPITISLTINIDGLPLFKSSKVEFWPILFNIVEMPKTSSMVIGIFCGKAKTSDIDSFLTPFVDELGEIMENGLFINSNKITVRLRCILCDSPARAYVKGVANFNSQHGCLKCTTIGEYSYCSNTNVFPRTECERRTDEKFRRKLYGSHHKKDSPLLKLNIDMVEQVPVGDCLHLLHLGVMKRLLLGWRDGTFRHSQTKWRAETIEKVTEYLTTQCKMPAEFNRVVRGLDCLAHWKGTEYRTFLHYVGIVCLKFHLTTEAYEHFLLLFCAVTICSSKRYFRLLPLAHALLNQFIEIYKEIYGEAYVTSNVHNLIHLVDEVERFGELETFSAYPFENMLGKIKRLLRNGNRPLAQVAKRISEEVGTILPENERIASIPNSTQSQSRNVSLSKKNNGENVPERLKLATQKVEYYSKVDLVEYCLSTDPANCWFLSKKNEIVRVNNILFRGRNDVKLCCVSTEEKSNFFTIPIESKFLDIYCTNSNIHVPNFSTKLFDLREIKCKLVRLKDGDINVFVPILHTYIPPEVDYSHTTI